MNNRFFIFVFCLLWIATRMEAQEIPRTAAEMSQMTPGLITIEMQTQYFTGLAPDLNLSSSQTEKLKDLLYQSAIEETRLSADLKVATAEIDRLLTEPEVDLKLLKQKLGERYHLAAEADFFYIQHAIAA